VEERLARLADPVVPGLADFCTRDGGSPPGEGRMMRPSGPRDPAWLWYGVAAAALLAVLVLELTGVLGRLGP
jgi:hypothetical protein